MAQRVNESIEVEAPVEDVFRYWSNFENFSNFMQNVEEVRMTDADTSHWRVKGLWARPSSSTPGPPRWTRTAGSGGTRLTARS
jgi:uncharacterized protein YndB with AHSA1/START domain